jgi:hypothetical protein
MKVAYSAIGQGQVYPACPYHRSAWSFSQSWDHPHLGGVISAQRVLTSADLADAQDAALAGRVSTGAVDSVSQK